MTSILTSGAWSAPITVAGGDILQNSGTRSILVCAEATANPDDSLLIRPLGWYTCLEAMTIRVATHGVGIGRITVGRGLGNAEPQLDVTILTPTQTGFIVESMAMLPDWIFTPTSTGFTTASEMQNG